MDQLTNISIMTESYKMIKEFHMIEASFNTQIIKGAINHMTNLKSLLKKEQTPVNKNELKSINIEINKLIQKIISDGNTAEIDEATRFLRDLSETNPKSKSNTLVIDRVRTLIAARRKIEHNNEGNIY